MHFIQGIGVVCCAIIMGIAALLGLNYLEMNICSSIILKPLLIIIVMGGCLLKAVTIQKNVASCFAILFLGITAVTTGLLTKMAFDYGKQVPSSVALSTNQWAVNSWNAFTSTILHIDSPTEAAYMDQVDQSGIQILQKYGHDLYEMGYFELNLIIVCIPFSKVLRYPLEKAEI